MSLTKMAPIAVRAEGGESRIKVAFGNRLPKVCFNSDILKQLLLQWIITNNISFR